jgi:hypothetical protein
MFARFMDHYINHRCLYYFTPMKGRIMSYINLPEHYRYKTDAHKTAEEHETNQSPFAVLAGWILVLILITAILLIGGM